MSMSQGHEITYDRFLSTAYHTFPKLFVWRLYDKSTMIVRFAKIILVSSYYNWY